MSRSLSLTACFLYMLVACMARSNPTSVLFAQASPAAAIDDQSSMESNIIIGASDDTNNTTNATTADDTNNTTNVTAPTTSPTPAITSPTPPSPSTKPTAPMTPSPTKKYEAVPDDNGDDEKKGEEKKKPSVGYILAWCICGVGFLWVLCYFRDAILFFFGSAWNNTRRYGCKGCIQSFCPCIFGARSGGDGGSSEPLDQIIFETDDADLNRGLMD